MITSRLVILIFLLGAQAISSLGLSNGLVMCLGPSGHIAIEHADHEPDCDHGCPGEPDMQTGFDLGCTTDHTCADVGLTEQLTNRLPNEKRILAPPSPVICALPMLGELASARLPQVPDPAAHSRGSPPPQLIKTVVLRL